MAKKEFNIAGATDSFFTNSTQNTDNKQNTHDTQNKSVKRGRPPKEKPLRAYRYNLTLDNDLNGFLHFISWKNRLSMTQYINDLLRKEMQKYIDEGGSTDGWENE